MSKDGRVWLSHTGLENLQRCPRCFWLQYNKGIRQPEGIVSRLANQIDIILKNYFDSFRTIGELPPMVSGKLEGKLQNPFQEKYFVRIDDEYGFLGKLDECLINDAGEYIPVDFKTSSSDPREKETLSAYQSQIDSYIFIIAQNKMKVAGFGFLVYIYPDQSPNLHNGFPMVIHVTKITGDPQNTVKRITNAINVLESQMPSPKPDCPFCNWYEKIKVEVGEKNEDNKISLPITKEKSSSSQNKKIIENLQLDFG